MIAEHMRAVLEILPTAFQRLSAAGDRLHAAAGLSSGMRGILMSIHDRGPLTVPRLAAMRPVSRQFIQKLVDDMITSGWLEALPNPSHKRSALIGLTPKGRAAVNQIHQIEEPHIDVLSQGLTADELLSAANVLRTIAARLNSDQQQGFAETQVKALGRGAAHV